MLDEHAEVYEKCIVCCHTIKEPMEVARRPRRCIPCADATRGMWVAAFPIFYEEWYD